jgi:hypothetical protein
MSVISQCIEPGCSTLCIGMFCVQHDARPVVDFPRGRPWPPQPRLPSAAMTVPVASGAPKAALMSVLPAA